MNSQQLGVALKSGQRVYGTLVISPAPSWPTQVKRLGLDFVFIDTEHISLDRHQLSWMCQTFRALEIAPLVRIPSPDPYQATMVLDGGASGVIAPYIETVEQVKALRGAVKLRPLKGQYLQRIVDGHEDCGEELSQYLKVYNKNHLLIINIESQPAIDALDDILGVPDIDAVLIGPHDLSCSLGIPEQYDHPRFDEAVRIIIRKARASGIGAGMHFWAGLNQQVTWAREENLNLIIHRADILAFFEYMDSEINKIKEALDDKAV
ncbi:MAG: aldolase [Pyrinomonadaceae bacterium]|nr:aldolase [Pyrinomonadaceae bacterium]